MKYFLALTSLASLAILLLINKKQNKVMTDLTVLQDEVRENKEVIDSAITLLKGLKERLDQAGTDPAKLKELSDSLDASTNALARAVAENTPTTTEPEEEKPSEGPEEETPGEETNTGNQL